MMIIWTAFAIECSAKKWLQADSISSQTFYHQHLQLQNITRFGYFTKLDSVRLNGDGCSRMNRCNQRRQILDVRQGNCYHQFFVTVKQVVRHFDAVAESMDLSVYSCLWRMSGTKLFRLTWSRNR